ncbi:MAG: glutaredoxin family protein [Rhodocyclaceae bacterium]
MPAERAPAAALTLYGREGCHLCEAMEAALQRLRPRFAFDLACVDIDDDPALARRYGALVPVLVAEGRELCHHVLDEAALAAYLAGIG